MKPLVLFLFPFLVYSQWVSEQENTGLYEGDMILSPQQKADIESGVYHYATTKENLWPKQGNVVIVPYVIDALSPHAQIPVQKAAEDYRKYTCIQLVPRTKEVAYLRFHSERGCSSPVGYQGRVNNVSLAAGCLRHGTVLHEIAHSLGIYHEQSRPDRDNHVEIVWDNIEPGAKFNFNKQTTLKVDSLGTPYDYKSIMHYGGTAFGKGSITIKTKDPAMQNVIGQRNGFSDIDIKQLNLLYRCNGESGGTIPTQASTNAPQSGCVDTHTNCASLSVYCNINNWLTHMKTYCKKTCKFC